MPVKTPPERALAAFADASEGVWRARQTAVGTPGVDYAIPNPELVRTKVCYGLTPTGLTTVVAAYTEVHPIPCPTCALFLVQKAHMTRMSHVRTCALMQTACAAPPRSSLHGGGSVHGLRSLAHCLLKGSGLSSTPKQPARNLNMQHMG